MPIALHPVAGAPAIDLTGKTLVVVRFVTMSARVWGEGGRGERKGDGHGSHTHSTFSPSSPPSPSATWANWQ